MDRCLKYFWPIDTVNPIFEFFWRSWEPDKFCVQCCRDFFDTFSENWAQYWGRSIRIWLPYRFETAKHFNLIRYFSFESSHICKIHKSSFSWILNPELLVLNQLIIKFLSKNLKKKRWSACPAGTNADKTSKKYSRLSSLHKIFYALKRFWISF